MLTDWSDDNTPRHITSAERDSLLLKIHFNEDEQLPQTLFRWRRADQFFFIGGGVIVKMVQKAYKLLSQKLFADAQAIPLSELVANYYFRTLPLAYGHA